MIIVFPLGIIFVPDASAGEVLAAKAYSGPLANLQAF
jgi:hypothetical protein